MENDFVPSELIRTTARKWWILVLAMILGGLAGMLITRAHKPVYQSQAIITTAVDYAYTGSLQDFELDHLVMAVGEVIDSTTVRDIVIENVLSDGATDSADKILNNLNLIRKGNSWLLTVRASDPVTAQKIALVWGNKAIDVLAALRTTATDAFHIQVAQFALEDCLSRTVVVEPVSSGCSSEEMDELRQFLATSDQPDAALDYRESILLSNLSFELTKEPELSSSPVLFRQNLNVLAGALIGLIVALGVLFGGKPQKT
jgi:capsular polysaccharide biosynthesis protein